MSTRNEFSLKDAIGEWIKRSPLQRKLNELQIIEAYEKAVGPILYKKTKQITIKGNQLHLHFESAPLRAELFQSRSDLLKAINDQFSEPPIIEIVFS